MVPNAVVRCGSGVDILTHTASPTHNASPPEKIVVESPPIRMNNQPQPSQQASLNLLTQIANHIRLVWRLMLDPRVSWGAKLVPLLTLVYVISPVDFLPDLIPGLGQLDDLAVIFLGLSWFIELCPPQIVDEHRRALRGAKSGDVVDAEYRVVDDATNKH